MSRNKMDKMLTSRRNTPLSGLVTYSEQTVSSQATVLSQRTQDWDPETDDYEDIVGEEGEQLRISPEEQQRIQGVLQLTRKGKINSTNAFEVPVRVADPQLGEGKSLRFWKFASELLTASMGIYDKRVEHLFLGTHRMFDSLLRTPSHPNPEQSSKGPFRELPQGLIVPEGECSGYQLGSCQCEDPERLDGRGVKGQFKTDPLFSKKLQAFDSDSLRSLFLNIFETGPHLQVVFFHQSRQNSQQSNISLMGSQSNHNQNDNDSTRTAFSSEGALPDYLEAELGKLNLLASTRSSYHDLVAFREENKRLGFLPQEQHVLVEEQDLAYGKSEPNFRDDATQLSQFTQFSEDIGVSIPRDQEEESLQAVSEGFGSNYFLNAQPSYLHPEETTPWNLEFRGLKLQRHRRVKRGRAGEKRKKENKEGSGVDFLDGVSCKRNDILKTKFVDPDKLPKPSSFQDRFLLPNQLDYNRFPQREPQTTRSLESENTFLGPPQTEEPLMLEIETAHWAPREEETEMGEQGTSRWGLSQMSQSQGLTNVREVKELVASRVRECGCVRLSELGLGGSSALVVALHLANELRVQLVGGQNEADVQLRAI